MAVAGSEREHDIEVYQSFMLPEVKPLSSLASQLTIAIYRSCRQEIRIALSHDYSQRYQVVIFAKQNQETSLLSSLIGLLAFRSAVVKRPIEVTNINNPYIYTTNKTCVP